jgi:hypothetical protein
MAPSMPRSKRSLPNGGKTMHCRWDRSSLSRLTRALLLLCHFHLGCSFCSPAHALVDAHDAGTHIIMATRRFTAMFLKGALHTDVIRATARCRFRVSSSKKPVSFPALVKEPRLAIAARREAHADQK